MKKILIADDRPEVRSLLLVTLDVGEFEIFEASNGAEALEQAQSKKPDLLLLDVMMPGGMDGYEVCQLLKSNPDTKGIIIILLTAKGQDADRKHGSEVGADDYFVKPFSPRDLLDKVYTILKL